MMPASWASMMAAMMLPGALPAIARSQRAPLFAGSYLVVWMAAGLAIYALYAPPAPAVALIQKELLA
jgi:predicted metal-binding membrane protein